MQNISTIEFVGNIVAYICKPKFKNAFMRIFLTIKADEIIIPFEHQNFLVGTINKWLNMPNEHGEVSLYSFSWLKGGSMAKNGFYFKNGASMFFSAYSTELIKHIVDGIMKDPKMFNGLEVKEVLLQQEPDLANKEIFLVNSPVLLKKREEGRIKHVLFDDPESAGLLKSSLETKMKIAGLADETLDIRFKSNYPRAVAKLINYKGIRSKASWCPVIINAKPETKVFARNVGVGVSTGIGFGAVE